VRWTRRAFGATLGASSVTLGRLLKHLALIEDYRVSRRLRGRDLGPSWDTVDWDADPDWEWHSASEVHALFGARWRPSAGRRSDEVIVAAFCADRPSADRQSCAASHRGQTRSRAPKSCCN
jgi:hypothetical protein